jgi:hypothetical protein
MGMLSGNWIVFGSLVVLTFDMIHPWSNACRLNDEIRPLLLIGRFFILKLLGFDNTFTGFTF